MAKNRGKDFEGYIEEALEKIPNNILGYQRLYDVFFGYKGISNPCDFIVYKYPNEFFIECKSTNINTLNFHEIPQYERLLDASVVKGRFCGLFIWYVKHKKTFWVSVEKLKELKDIGDKSVNIKDLLDKQDKNVCEIPATYKIINGVYDLYKFFEFIQNEQ